MDLQNQERRRPTSLNNPIQAGPKITEFISLIRLVHKTSIKRAAIAEVNANANSVRQQADETPTPEEAKQAVPLPTPSWESSHIAGISHASPQDDDETSLFLAGNTPATVISCVGSDWGRQTEY